MVAVTTKASESTTATTKKTNSTSATVSASLKDELGAYYVAIYESGSAIVIIGGRDLISISGC